MLALHVADHVETVDEMDVVAYCNDASGLRRWSENRY